MSAPKQTVTVAFPKLHHAQKEVYDYKARFKVLSCGRRWGKTSLAYVTGAEVAISGGRVWWLAPTFQLTTIGWRLFTSNLSKIAIYKNETEKRLVFPGGGEIWFKTSSEPDNLRGDSLDLAIFDEAAFTKGEVWTYVVMPMLSDRLGKAMFISSPNGATGYFYDLWKLGEMEYDNMYKSWNFPTSSNPFIPRSDIEHARMMLPRVVFEQEWLGLFVGDSTSVFPNIDNVCILAPQEPRSGTYYVGGLDWAAKNDFSVITIFDAMTKQQVSLERINGVSFEEQYAMIKGLCDKYNVTKLLVEENAIGLAPFQELRNRGIPAIAFTTTNESKQRIVSQLIYAMESDTIELLNNDILKDELRSFKSERLPSGKWRYAASGKKNDDTVIATLLANSMLSSAVPLAPTRPAVIAKQTNMPQQQRNIFTHANNKTNRTFGY